MVVGESWREGSGRGARVEERGWRSREGSGRGLLKFWKGAGLSKLGRRVYKYSHAWCEKRAEHAERAKHAQESTVEEQGCGSSDQ